MQQVFIIKINKRKYDKMRRDAFEFINTSKNS